MGRNLLVANYYGGNVACLPLAADGSLKPVSSVMQHEGHGVHPERQEAAHAHSIHLAESDEVAIAVDLGLDRLVFYAFDGEAGRFLPHARPAVSTARGAGPRHLAFHPSGRYAYVDNELASTVTAYARADGGGLKEIQTLPTLPAGFAGASTAAEVAVSADGGSLYVSNRGHDSIAVFSIDAATGRLAARGHVESGGRTPRHFALAPGGAHLLVANQDSGNVVVFARDPETGDLTPTGASIDVPRAVCVRFLSAR